MPSTLKKQESEIQWTVMKNTLFQENHIADMTDNSSKTSREFDLNL